MAWNASSLFHTKAVQLSFALFGAASSVVAWMADGGFDRDKWEDLRKGIDYLEERQEIAEAAESSNPFAWAILLELLRYASILLLVVGLVVVVLKLLGVVNFKKAKKQAPEASPSGEAAPTALSSLEALRAALEEARQRGDYREAIRLLYQLSLRYLALGGKVNVLPEKTNWDYVDEISERSTAEDFAKLTMVFEHMWFGKAEASAERYAVYAPLFDRFISKNDHAKQV